MKSVCGLTVLGCLFCAALAGATDGEEIAFDKLPQDAINSIKHSYADAELLHARKEIEDGKECYTVAIKYDGNILILFVSPDGLAITRKYEFSFAEYLELSIHAILLFLLPGAVIGAIARRLLRAVKGDRPSILSEWFAAWFGAAVWIGILSAVLAITFSSRRGQDWILTNAYCIVWGAVSASVVEIMALAAQSIRDSRVACRRWILGLCVVVLVLLLLSVALYILGIERENQYFRGLAMRAPATR